MTILRPINLPVPPFAVLACLLLCAEPAAGHEEPPKTLQERLEQYAQRKKTAAHRLLTETVWKHADGKRTRLHETRFDADGNAAEITLYDADGAVALRTVNRYTADNLLWEQIAVSPADTERTVFSYTSAGLIASATDFAPSGFARSRLEYEYADTLITVVKYDSSDMNVYRIRYHYPGGTETGIMTGARQEDGWEEQMLRIENEYVGGLRTAKRVFNAADSLDYTFLYTYRPDGEFDSIVKRTSDGATAFTRRYRYAADGLLESIIEYDAAGAVRMVLESTYERRPG